MKNKIENAISWGFVATIAVSAIALFMDYVKLILMIF